MLKKNNHNYKHLKKISSFSFIFIFYLQLLMAFLFFDYKQVFADPKSTSVLNQIVTAQKDTETPVFKAKVIGKLPKDARHFTQGYFFIGNKLYESTGLKGESALYHINAKTGTTVEYRCLREYFAEGGTELNGHIHLLTWQDKVRFIIDPKTLKIIETKPLSGEGWGICNADLDNTKPLLWYSDGSATLRLMKVHKNFDWEQIKQITVYDPKDKKPVDCLNELEFINGYIFANIWKSNKIAIIDPNNVGKDGFVPVMAWLDCQDLFKEQCNENKHNMYWNAESSVLNGIAWNKEKQKLFVTGKLWNKSYELSLPNLVLESVQ
ncbi:glutaminyl-peptide cyclotransferase [Desulfovibrio litoralis]|uniref:Glutamine cyclotransferase n=1 Tax=Desulfovibrio litoralis DSM 11393 TaxID=1121455 RepID=A0A1M7T2G3_9BACT|nr:glutaminyl-peptide cyclotransferase [Desulfovibrio litoralis]SHN64889.1 Glutamine cyclotransferase [Desulfovibrio litoralis DSM 11393]